jgi:hypothetical protein
MSSTPATQDLTHGRGPAIGTRVLHKFAGDSAAVYCKITAKDLSGYPVKYTLKEMEGQKRDVPVATSQNFELA